MLLPPRIKHGAAKSAVSTICRVPAIWCANLNSGLQCATWFDLSASLLDLADLPNLPDNVTARIDRKRCV